MLSVLALASLATPNAAEGCPENWFLCNGQCYGYFSEPLTYEAATTKCDSEATGAIPALIATASQNRIAEQLITVMGGHEPWIGLSDGDAGWQWAGTVASDYHNWDNGQPANSDNKCAQMRYDSSSGTFKSADCGTEAPATLCSIPTTGTDTHTCLGDPGPSGHSGSNTMRAASVGFANQGYANARSYSDKDTNCASEACLKHSFPLNTCVASPHMPHASLYITYATDSKVFHYTVYKYHCSPGMVLFSGEHTLGENTCENPVLSNNTATLSLSFSEEPLYSTVEHEACELNSAFSTAPLPLLSVLLALLAVGLLS